MLLISPMARFNGARDLSMVAGFCALLLAFAPQVPACSVPVFRYGLEHWTADPYRVFVVHNGALPEEASAQLRRLRESGGAANLVVQSADIASGASSEVLDAWKHAGSPELPWLIVRPPATTRVPLVVWSVAFSPESVDVLLESPARRAIKERLGEGQSAVFVFLESGNAGEDNAAVALLDERLKYLATVMELPRLDEQDIRNGLVSVPPDGLRLEFSSLRVSRSAPEERAFVQMLLATEPDLRSATGPIVFPVFGQGRALYALVGKGIKHETIDAAASFLIGSCSCQVKEQNPGADLLMAVDWKALLKNQAVGLADLPTAKEIIGGMPEAVTITAKAPEGTRTESMETVAAEGVNVGRLIAIAIALILVIVIGGMRVAASRRGVR